MIIHNFISRFANNVFGELYNSSRKKYWILIGLGLRIQYIIIPTYSPRLLRKSSHRATFPACHCRYLNKKATNQSAYINEYENKTFEGANKNY